MDNPKISIIREALTLEEQRQKYRKATLRRKKENWKQKVGSKVTSPCCTKESLKSAIKSKFPILNWLLGYRREWFIGDLISGITIAIIHVPQGLGFAMLANVPPIAGIYMAVFPCIIYSIFASSNHCSMGSFAVITLMTGKVVTDLATFPTSPIQSTLDELGNATIDDGIRAQAMTELTNKTMEVYTPFQVATVVAFTVGAWHLLFGLLQLGKLCICIADVFVSGFTTGAAVHVVTSQLKHILGVEIPGTSGPLRIIMTFYEIFKALPTANGATILISAITMTVLAFNNEIIKPRLAKRTRVPVPIELIEVIIATTVCYLAQLNVTYGVVIIGEMPRGLPAPSQPPLNLMSQVAFDSFLIACVSYVCDYSVGKIFAQRHGYTIDANQELYAHGLGNICGSFFSCPPMATALARSVIIDSIGGKTQLVSIIAAALLFPILLFAGPLFEYLPNAVFASIIIVTLKGMLMQITQFFDVLKVSKVDALIWMVTFLSTVVIDIDYGLFIGILFSLGVLMHRGQNTIGTKLGHLEALNIYVDVNKYPQAKEIPHVAILQLVGSLHFANREGLKGTIIEGTGLNPANPANHENPETKSKGVSFLILDMAAVTSVDNSAGKYLETLRTEYTKIGVQLCLSGLGESVFRSMEKTGALRNFSQDHLFHSISDAVVILTAKQKATSAV